MHRHTWWPKSSTERSTPILAQHRATRRRRPGSASNSEDRSTGDEAARADGGSSTSPSCTSAKKSWYRTWPDGAASACRSSPPPRTSRSLRTGCARCSQPPRAKSTCRASARSTPPPGSHTCGSSTRWTATLEAFELLDGRWLLIASAPGRRPGEHPPVRCDHVQPRRAVGLNGHLTIAQIESGESQLHRFARCEAPRR